MIPARDPAGNANPDVSVLVVSWNTRDLLRECLRSIYLRPSSVSLEVICVDNASSDGSVEMVRREYPQVRIIANQTNERFVAANNQAIQVARGRYVLLLNSDTIVLEDAIGALVRFADRNPRGAVFGGRVLNPDLTLQRSCFRYPSVLNALLSATYLYKIFPRSQFFGRQFMTWWSYDDSREVETVSGCFALVRREAIQAVGAMDPIFYFYVDDDDWCYRFASEGWKVMFTPEARIIHYGGRSTRIQQRSFLLQLHGSVLVFMRIHRGRMSFILMRLLIGTFFLIRMPYWWLKGALDSRNRRSSLETAITYAIGCLYAFFSWERLLVNRTEVGRMLRDRKREKEQVWKRDPP